MRPAMPITLKAVTQDRPLVMRSVPHSAAVAAGFPAQNSISTPFMKGRVTEEYGPCLS